MPDFVLQDDQNVNCALNLIDDANNVVQGQTLDAGSATATVSDTTVLEATITPDQTVLNIKALGPEATGVTVEVTGTIAGTPVANPGSIAVDVQASPAVSIGIVPGTPSHN